LTTTIIIPNSRMMVSKLIALEASSTDSALTPTMKLAPIIAAPVRSIRKPGKRPIASTTYVIAKIRIAAN
jgi:hypothetical protein